MPPEPPKDDRAHLADMAESARLAVEYLAAVSHEQFAANPMIQDAVIRRIEVLGEASRRVGDRFRESTSDIPWHKIRGMRNILAHQYDGIDHGIIYNVVKHEFPALITSIEGILKALDTRTQTETP